MKKNDLILLISVGCYSYLFYEQLPGINFLVFNIIILFLMVRKRPEVLGLRNWRIAAAGAMLSAICIAWHGNLLSSIANILSLGLVAAYAINAKNSVVAGLLMSFVSVISSWYFIIINQFIIRPAEAMESEEKPKQPFSTKMLVYGVPVIIVIIFFALYRNSNPVFDYFASKINFDFISFQWVLFTIFGWLLLFGFFCYREWKEVSTFDIKSSGTITSERINPNNLLNKILTVGNENTSGIMLFLLLNLMLLLVNIIDINFLFLNGELPKSVNRSQMVHQGVDALIWSIILAISLILYHFRGRLNFFENNRWIKVLALVWIFQNIFMVFSTGVRNEMYITADGITAKRIGVYFYLGLCIIGLIFTFVKILKLKTNWELVRQASFSFYIVLLLSCLFNWEAFITDYNVGFQKTHRKQVDGGYFVSLSAASLGELIDLRNKSIKYGDLPAEWQHIDDDILHFMKMREQTDWRSWCRDDQATYDDLKRLSRQGKLNALYLNSMTSDELADIAPLQLQKLSIGIVSMDSLPDLSALENLKELHMEGGSLRKLDGIEKLKNLEVLEIKNNNNIYDYAPLTKLVHLKKMYLTDYGINEVSKIQPLMPNTEFHYDQKNIPPPPPTIEVPKEIHQ